MKCVTNKQTNRSVQQFIKLLMLVLRCTTFLGTFVDEQLPTHQKLLYNNILTHGVMWHCNNLLFNKFLTN
jgi:transcriptional regulator of met regulon